MNIPRNSSEIIGRINKVEIFVMLMLSVFTTMSTKIVTIIIMVTLLIIDQLAAIITLFGFGSLYFIISLKQKIINK